MKAESRRVATVAIGERLRRDLGDLRDLMESMERIGLLQPIVLDSHGVLIAGRRRLEAAKRLGWVEIDCRVADNLDRAVEMLVAERDENACRLDFTRSEAVAIALRLEEMERPRARERMESGINQHTEPSGKLPQGSTGKVRDRVAAAVGMSGRTYEKARAVVEAAADETVPEPVRQVARQALEEMDRTGKVDPAFRAVRGQRSAAGSVPLPPPSNGLHFAKIAIVNLKQIRQDDLEREQAVCLVASWVDEQRR